MTRAIELNVESRVLIQPFPVPGRLGHLAYRELDVISSGAQDQLLALRDLRELPAALGPVTCETPQLRKEVWSWLEAVVTSLNHEYAGTLPMSSRRAGRNILTWCTSSRFWQISVTAPVKRSAVTRWRSGTATACPSLLNG